MQLFLFGLQKSQTSRLELVQSAAGAFSRVQRSADTSPPHWSNCNNFFLISRSSSKQLPWFYRLFRHLLQPIVPRTSWARSTPGYTKRLESCPKRAADHSPSWRGCDQSKLFSSDLSCALPIWEKLLSSTLLSSRRTSKYAEDGTLRSQKPLSWRRATIGVAWSIFAWEGMPLTAILKTAMWTLLRPSIFPSKTCFF